MGHPVFDPDHDDEGPDPSPLGLTGEEDQLLVTSLRRWLDSRHVGGNRRAANAIRRWMTVKGLD